MARESFLIRTDPKVLAALRKWAEDEMRSANGQIDFLLRKALKDAGRWDTTKEKPSDKSSERNSGKSNSE